MAKIEINSKISSDLYHLFVMDVSSWGTIVNEPSVIDITLPGFEFSKTFYFDKGKTNIYNSIILGLNHIESGVVPKKLVLPDGVYTVRITGSPSKHCEEFYYLKTDQIDLDIAKLYIEKSAACNKKALLNKLFDIKGLIMGAESHIEFENFKLANSLFEEAQEEVDHLLNCKDCCC